MSILQELSQLIFPSRCFGCSTLATSICANCSAEWKVRHYLTKLDNLEVQSAVLYTPVAAKVILAAKESGIASADELLIQVIIGVLEKVKLDTQPFRLVPIPSSRQSQRRRGRSFIVDLVQEISDRTGIPTLNCLALANKVADQSGLSRKQRLENMKGAFCIKQVARGNLILIDDVVTTGATLKEAARALNSQGLRAHISAITACVAQPLR